MTQSNTFPQTDRAHDVLRESGQPLEPFFSPRNVALIGATETPGSVGRTLLWNLVSNPFGGTIFPVNPKRPSVLGIKAYPDIKSVPDKVDLAVIVTPASTVPGIIGQCIEVGVKAAIIISAGFKELGAPGIALEQDILNQARHSKLRIIGPNCLGVMNPITGLNATFAGAMARPGNVAFISQSGALCTAVLDWSFKQRVGFSAFISIGSMLDVNWGHLIDYLGDDPHTKSIVIYMESIGDARAFLSAAREVALNKPIIVIKAGRTEAAAKAAASHTGSLTGSDEVLDAAFRRCGVLRVNDISEVFDMAEVLSKQPRPKGPRLSIVTNAGGPGVLATDALILAGGELAQISAQTIDQLNQFLPAAWSRNNPIDILGDADPERYSKSLEIAARDPASDGLLVILTPQDMTDPTQTAEKLRPFAKIPAKPILASWMGGPIVAAGEDILNRAGIPTYPYPDTAARAFHYMWKYSYNLRGLYETPSMATDAESAINRQAADSLIQQARQAGRTLLTEVESKKLLTTYGIPTVETSIATCADQAVQESARIGFPVVLKLYSQTITHKTDVGGVKLNLHDDASVRDAFKQIRDSVNQKAGTGHFHGVSVQPMIRLDGYEIIIGSSIDPQFGPVLLFGAGGQLVEIFKDRALALPPLNATLARRMIEQTRIYKALKGVRGRKPVDLDSLAHLLVRFSQLVIEQKWIKEIDINPLLVSAERQVALDARVVVQGMDVDEQSLPRPAIRPYPTQYITPWTLTDGTPVTIRPIRPEDEPLLVHFHQTLSERSVRLRYFHPMKLNQRTTHERLTRVCFNDYDRDIALVADHQNPATGHHEILGVARLSKLTYGNQAEFALLISDQWQNRGLGSRMLELLIKVGWDEKLSRITADILPDNLEMQRICQKLGFTLTQDPLAPVIKAAITQQTSV